MIVTIATTRENEFCAACFYKCPDIGAGNVRSNIHLLNSGRLQMQIETAETAERLNLLHTRLSLKESSIRKSSSAGALHITVQVLPMLGR